MSKDLPMASDSIKGAMYWMDKASDAWRRDLGDYQTLFALQEARNRIDLAIERINSYAKEQDYGSTSDEVQEGQSSGNTGLCGKASKV